MEGFKNITEEEINQVKDLRNSLKPNLTVDNPKWKSFKKTIIRRLKSQGIERNMYAPEIKRLEDAFMQGPEVMGTKAKTLDVREDNFRKAVNAIIKYNNKSLKFDMLSEENLDIENMRLTYQKITTEKIDKLEETYEKLAQLQNSTLVRNFKEINKFINKVLNKEKGGERESKVGRVTVLTDFGFIKEYGKVSLGNAGERKKVYAYWKEIHGKYKDLVEAAKDFKDDVEDWSTKMRNTKDNKEFIKHYSKFKSFWGEEGKIIIPNYVLELNSFNMQIPESLPLAKLLIQEYVKLKGMSNKMYEDVSAMSSTQMDESDSLEDELQSEYEGNKPKGRKIGQGEATGDMVVEPSDLKEINVPKINAPRKIPIDVDPLFWYKFNDDYDNVIITKDNLEDITRIINFGSGSIGLKHIQFKDDLEGYIDDFDDWFKGMAKVVKEFKGPFYLPISNFIENEYIKSTQKKHESSWEQIKIELEKKEFEDNKKEGKIKGKPKEIKPESKRKLLTFSGSNRPSKIFTLKDLEDVPVDLFQSKKGKNIGMVEIADLEKGMAKEWKLATDKLYKINVETGNFLKLISETIEKIQSMFDVFISRVTEQGAEGGSATLGAIQMIGSEGEKRFIPKDIEKSWDALLDAIVEYYVLPMQSQNFVDNSEKPRWITDHSSTVIQIEKAENLPLGALQAKKSLSTMKVSDITKLTKFVRGLKMSASSGDSEVGAYQDGRDIVRVLNSMFGKEFENQNKYTVFHVINSKFKGKFLSDKSSLRLREFWGSKEDLQKGFDGMNATKSPLLVLYGIFDTQYARTLGLNPEVRMGSADVSGKPKGDLSLDFMSKDEENRIKALNVLRDVMEDIGFKATMKKADFSNMYKTEKGLLQAHDTLRKIQNKPTYESYLNTDNIEDMDIIITKIETEHKMDITAIEVNDIVKSVSSYSSLAKNFGVNEDVIYTVKAMFR